MHVDTEAPRAKISTEAIKYRSILAETVGLLHEKSCQCLTLICSHQVSQAEGAESSRWPEALPNQFFSLAAPSPLSHTQH